MRISRSEFLKTLFAILCLGVLELVTDCYRAERTSSWRDLLPLLTCTFHGARQSRLVFSLVGNVDRFPDICLDFPFQTCLVGSLRLSILNCLSPYCLRDRATDLP